MAAPPLVTELLPPPDPVGCCQRLEGLPYRLFLDSALAGTAVGRYSFLTADPTAVIHGKGGKTTYVDCSTDRRRDAAADPLDIMRLWIADYGLERMGGLPPFQGGAAGYVGYDWGLGLERLPSPRHDDLAMDDLVFGLYR